MATALQRQLAQISANSTHQLDLKAQKTQHAKSLLLEPRDAAKQSFDDIYHICVEGFEELQQLDPRFNQFASNLFSEGSKDIDRGQLTKAENEELDGVIEKYLSLVQGRLLLKPAQKSLEWLVRRFKVHEFNSEKLLLTFLPYHTDQRIFPTLLAILPIDRPLPESFKWLHPYVASFSCPPRHAVLASMISNRSLYSAFNSYVLQAAKAAYSSSILLAFWAGLIAQAVNGMLDSSRTGRDSVRRQREEDILLKVLPILQEALNTSRKRKLDEMFVGSCMIVTILATKASLSDATLDALMETVSNAWTDETMNEGVSCLAAVAEEKDEASLPTVVVKRMVVGQATASLVRQSATQRTGKLATGLALGVIRFAVQKNDFTNPNLAIAILKARVLPERQTVEVLRALKSLRQERADAETVALPESIATDLESDWLKELLREHGLESGLPESAGSLLGPSTASPDEMELDQPRESHGDLSGHDVASFDKILDGLPELPSSSHSFLRSESTTLHLFEAHRRAFQASLQSEQSQEAFLKLFLLDQSDTLPSLAFLTFFARVFTTTNPDVTTRAKVKALEITNARIDTFASAEQTGQQHNQQLQLDLQVLIPYLMVALADERRSVRAAAAAMCRTMQKHFKNARVKGPSPGFQTTPAIYTVLDSDAGARHWSLSPSQVQRLLDDAIVPVLEDCILDAEHVLRHMSGVLKGEGHESRTQQSETLRSEVRVSACTFLASHTCGTPVLQARMILLQMLGSLGADAFAAREQILIPFVKQWASLTSEQVTSWCSQEGVTEFHVDVAVLGVLHRRSEDHIKLLRDMCSSTEREELISAAFQRLLHLWPMIKVIQVKQEIVDWLVQLALGLAGASEYARDQALETLRAIELSPDITAHLLHTLPSASDLASQPPTAKRQRRTSDAAKSKAPDAAQSEIALRNITLVLELVETSKQDILELVKPLFHVLAELRQFKNLLGSELVYLHGMLLDKLLAVVSTLESNHDAAREVTKDAIRIDLLIDCVRSSSSSQIHNSALLIVSALASFAPESVLHSIIPLFTFMSSTVLRRGDEYSAHVTDQAVTRIIPALAESLKKKGKDLLGGVSELLLSFVAAWEHVPLHRRLGLFEMLVRAVGADDCLGIVAAMLVERYPDSQSSVSTFIVELTGCFEANTNLKAANQWLHLVFDALQPKSTSKHRKATLSDTLLNFSDKDKAEQSEAIETAINGLASLLQNQTLRERMASSLAQYGKDTVENMLSANVNLTQETVRLTQLPEIVSDSDLKTAAQNLLSAVLGLLPTDDFIASCAQLMQSGSSSVREHVFRSLESRVETSRSGNSLERQTFLNVLPSCTVFISLGQPIEVRIAAISCIDSICEKFGKSDRDSVKTAAIRVAGDAALGSDDDRLRVLSMLCLASVAGVLGDGDESASILPEIVSSTLDQLEKPTTAGTELQNAAFTLLTALLDHVPWIIASGPSNLKRALSCAMTVVNTSAAAEFRALAVKQVSAAELFKSIEDVWIDQVGRLESAAPGEMHAVFLPFQNLLKMLHETVQFHSKGVITRNSSLLFSLLLKAFDLRRQLGHADEKQETVGDAVIFATTNQTALDTTLKMNDATFRPFFNRLVEWATSEISPTDNTGRTARLKSLYGFALLLFEKLKSLVTSYMSFLLDNASEILKNSSSEANDPNLLDLIIKTLGSSFRHDEDDFWTAPAHFDVIASYLITLLGSKRTESTTEQTDAIISAITDLANAVSSSPEQLKAINGTLLSLLRHEKASVKLAAVQCERAITKSVSFDWLALLPELLPAISELQEDDDERVERQTLLWVREIEEISGESLEGMLA